MLGSIDKRDCAAVSELHCQQLSGLLFRFGASVLRPFYTVSLSFSDVIALKWEDEGEIQGFVYGSLSSQDIYSRAFRAGFLQLLWPMALRAFLRPKLAKDLILSLLSDGDQEEAESYRNKNELMFIAVSAKSTGSGIGKSLLRGFEAELLAKGQSSYGLFVDESNDRALQFYRKQGFQLNKKVKISGENRFYFTKSL